MREHCLQLLENALSANLQACLDGDLDHLRHYYDPHALAINEEHRVFQSSKMVNLYRAGVMKAVKEIGISTLAKQLHTAFRKELMADDDVPVVSPVDQEQCDTPAMTERTDTVSPSSDLVISMPTCSPTSDCVTGEPVDTSVHATQAETGHALAGMSTATTDTKDSATNQIKYFFEAPDYKSASDDPEPKATVDYQRAVKMSSHSSKRPDSNSMISRSSSCQPNSSSTTMQRHSNSWESRDPRKRKLDAHQDQSVEKKMRLERIEINDNQFDNAKAVIKILTSITSTKYMYTVQGMMVTIK